IALLYGLVEIYSPSHQERRASEYLAAQMQAAGFDNAFVDAADNAVGVLGEGARECILLGHIDTVAGYIPPRLEAGKLYGRGSCDMKGSLAASLAALAYAKQDGVLRGTALVSASVGEEVIEGLAFSRVLDRYAPDLVVICESTELRLVTAGRGRAEIALTTYGKSAHASTPHLGVNALKHMAKLISALDQLPPPEHERLGKGILEPTEIVSAPFPSISVLPYQCRARYDRRVLLGETAESVLEPIQAVIAALAAADPTFRAEASVDVGSFTCYTGVTLSGKKFQAAWQTESESPFVRAAQAALQRAGQAAQIGHYNFCTNGSYAASIGLPVIGYGAGLETTAHITDEYVTLDQLFGAAEGYYALGAAFGA
ncbi:MAG: M20/M25/M40 family metallo-hydrolase, partial [Aggregatilineales bacterium]